MKKKTIKIKKEDEHYLELLNKDAEGCEYGLRILSAQAKAINEKFWEFAKTRYNINDKLNLSYNRKRKEIIYYEHNEK